MATRAVLQTFEKYQKERVAFVTAVAEMAKNPQVQERTPGTPLPTGSQTYTNLTSFVLPVAAEH